MKHAIMLCMSNRGVHVATRASIDACRALGAQYVEHGGASDVTLARNLALSGVVHHFEKGSFREGTDTLVMVDDDMVFSAPDVQRLIAHARCTHEPASAMYATTLGTLAATRWAAKPGYWMVGLGLLAIPMSELLKLARKVERFTMGTDGDKHWAFTQSEWMLKPGASVLVDRNGELEGAWSSEDYTLCRRLGGVRLLPVAAGHMKSIPLWPDEETVAKIRDGAELEQYDGKSRMPTIVGRLGEKQ